VRALGFANWGGKGRRMGPSQPMLVALRGYRHRREAAFTCNAMQYITLARRNAM
jgi:hypothetical protein